MAHFVRHDTQHGAPDSEKDDAACAARASSRSGENLDATIELNFDASGEASRTGFAVANRDSLASAAIDESSLRAAYDFVARLHLAPQGDAAALDELNRVVAAGKWTLYSAQSLPSAVGSLPGIQFKMLAAFPPHTPTGLDAQTNSAHTAEFNLDEAGESISGGGDDTLETSKHGAVDDEAIPELQCARAAFIAATLTRQTVDGRDMLALPLIFDARIVGVLVGEQPRTAEDAPGATWSERDAQLLQTLGVPFAAWLAHRRQSAEAEQLLLTDDLTKMRNARYLREALISEIKRARRYNTQVSLLFLDLDNFKQVNDEHGHLVGSHVLVEAAGAILGGVRNTDTVARFGGDEFVVLLPETASERAEQVAERIRERIAAHIFTGGRRLALRVTASFGVASFPAHAQSPQRLIAAADTAMYRAKALNKNCIYTADALSTKTMHRG
jgi:diguanylate cyclase (GGDEF)-like protein